MIDTFLREITPKSGLLRRVDGASRIVHPRLGKLMALPPVPAPHVGIEAVPLEKAISAQGPLG